MKRQRVPEEEGVRLERLQPLPTIGAYASAMTGPLALVGSEPRRVYRRRWGVSHAAISMLSAAA